MHTIDLVATLGTNRVYLMYVHRCLNIRTELVQGIAVLTSGGQSSM